MRDTSSPKRLQRISDLHVDETSPDELYNDDNNNYIINVQNHIYLAKFI